MRRAALVLLAAGCDDPLVVAPVIDSPPPGSAAAVPRLDEVELALAVDGASSPLVAARFPRDTPIELEDVPYGEDLVLTLSGRFGQQDPAAIGRTCTFAIRSDGPPPEPHLYFAPAAFFAESDTPPNPIRIGGTAVTTNAGSGLFVGGRDPAMSTIDRFDPRTGAFAPPVPFAQRTAAAGARLGDGRVAIIGGSTAGNVASAIEIFDPDTGILTEWPGTVPVGAALVEHGDGRIITFGGVRDGMASDQITLIRASGSGVSVSSDASRALVRPRSGLTATAMSDDLYAQILIAGGVDTAGVPIAEAELFLPRLDDVDAAFTATLTHPRSGHVAVAMPDGSVLVIGGIDATGAAVRTIEQFTLRFGFTDVLDLPASAGVTGMSVTRLPDGRVLVTGGRDAAGVAVATTFLIRFSLDGTTLEAPPANPLLVARAGHGAALLCDGSVLVVGGTDAPASAERYIPPGE